MKQGTRGDFFSSVVNDPNEYPDIVTSFFEEFSVLYNIIGNYDNLKVFRNNSQMSFDIHTPSPAIADEICGKVDGEVVQVYDRTFTVYAYRTGVSDISIKIV